MQDADDFIQNNVHIFSAILHIFFLSSFFLKKT